MPELRWSNSSMAMQNYTYSLHTHMQYADVEIQQVLVNLFSSYGHKSSFTSHLKVLFRKHQGKNLNLYAWSITSNLLQVCPDIQHSLCPRGTTDNVTGGHKRSTSMRKRFPLGGWGMGSKVEGKVAPSWDELYTTLWLKENDELPHYLVQLHNIFLFTLLNWCQFIIEVIKVMHVYLFITF